MNDQTKKFMKAINASIGSGHIKVVSEEGSCLYLSARPKNLVLACQACLSSGAVFDSAFVSSPPSKLAGEFDLHYLFRAAEIRRMIIITSRGRQFDALSATVNAALWDERKIQDLTGLRLSGIPDSRPLIFHPESGFPGTHPLSGLPYRKTASRHYEMKGTGSEGEFEVAVGPVHAGIIEPGHFRFHVIGEKINKMETRMFYLHRGIEKAAEGQSAAAIVPLIEQISGDESVANSVAYCKAVERAFVMQTPKRAESIRAILMELERIYSHLADLGGMTTDVGFYMSSSRFAVLREDCMRLNQAVSGNRFLRGMCVVGGVSRDLDKHKAASISSALERLLHSLVPLERTTFTASTFLDRTFQTGTVSKGTARDLALVGPPARACGISSDLRLLLPYSAYVQTEVNESMEKEAGDVLARFQVKLAEIHESVRLIRALIATLPQGELKNEPPKKLSEARMGVGWAEAPRGSCTFLVAVSPNGAVRRMACRSASFRNWRALERAVENNIVPDFPLINKSFNLSYAGADV